MRDMRGIAGLFAVGMLALAGCSGGESGEPSELQVVTESGIAVIGHFGADGEESEDMSGLACDWDSGADEMLCVAIDDESAEARWAVFDGAALTVGDASPLIDGYADSDMPRFDVDSGCPNRDAEAREFDGEGAAYDDGAYYVVGSHGCARGGGEYRPASFFVARLSPEIDAEGGGRIMDIAASANFGMMMAAQTELADYFLQPLNQANGLNIEGLAVHGDRMTFGLRAPVIEGEAFLVDAPIVEIFAAPGTAKANRVTVRRVALGQHAGIRDLAYLPDGRLLILSGPAQEQPVPYRIHLLGDDGELTALTNVTPPRDAKAEAIALVGIEGDSVRLIVMFDSADDGAPRLLRLDLP